MVKAQVILSREQTPEPPQESNTNTPPTISHTLDQLMENGTSGLPDTPESKLGPFTPAWPRTERPMALFEGS